MGELLGVQVQPKDIAKLCYNQGWELAEELVTAVAVCLSESQGYMRAYNDNKDADGNVLSRDCGLFQINIPGSKIGSAEEEKLFSDAEYNVYRAWLLYDSRGFQPWVAYNKAVYLRDGYIERATRGVGNFLAELLLVKETDTLSGTPYVHSITSPVLNLQRRVEILSGACSRVAKLAKDLKAISPAVVDVKLDEIIKVVTTARNEAKK